MGAKARLVTTTPEQVAAERLRQLQDGIEKTRQSLKTPTFPDFQDGDFPDDPVETQVAFKADKPHYYKAGAWHPFKEQQQIAAARSEIATAVALNPGTIQVYDVELVPQLGAPTFFDTDVYQQDGTSHRLQIIQSGVFCFDCEIEWHAATGFFGVVEVAYSAVAVGGGSGIANGTGVYFTGGVASESFLIDSRANLFNSGGTSFKYRTRMQGKFTIDMTGQDYFDMELFVGNFLNQNVDATATVWMYRESDYSL